MDEVDGMSSGDRGGIQELVLQYYHFLFVDQDYQNHSNTHYLYL